MTKIFIAEDEETLAEIYSERFKRQGFEVSVFKNGLELIEKLGDETPDVILLDLKMPEMNGYEVLETIHNNFADAGKKNVKVIVWSNSNNNSEVDKALKSGATAYLHKIDYSGDDLVEKVKEILGKNDK